MQHRPPGEVRGRELSRQPMRPAPTRAGQRREPRQRNRQWRQGGEGELRKQGENRQQGENHSEGGQQGEEPPAGREPASRERPAGREPPRRPAGREPARATVKVASRATSRTAHDVRRWPGRPGRRRQPPRAPQPATATASAAVVPGGGDLPGQYDEPEITEDDVLAPVAGILDVAGATTPSSWTSGYLPGPNDVYVSLGLQGQEERPAREVTPSPARSALRTRASNRTSGRSSTPWSGWTPSTA